MSQISLHLVIDSETATVHMEGTETMPPDSDEYVFDDPDWRTPTPEEYEVMMAVEANVVDALKAAGLTA